MKPRLRLLIVGSPEGTAGAVVAKALARGHRVTPRDPASALAAALAGHDAIVADETVGRDDLRRVVDAARRSGVRRVVLVSTDGTATEDLLAAGQLDWTIARPAPLTDGGLSLRYRVTGGGLPRGPRPVSRIDLAHFLLHELERPVHVGSVVGVSR
jgi:putative NADH-flavin reductase